MKKVAKVAGVVLAVGCVMGMAACGGNKGEDLAIGKSYVVADSQLAALMKLDQGVADVAVIDSVMAGYYTATGDYATKMQMVDGLVLAEESYGIAAKKGSQAFMSKINEALIAIRETKYADVAEEYGLTSSIALTAATTNPYADATDNSWTEVVESGTIVLGYTEFAPIAFKVDGTLTGFDIDLANEVVAWLNATYEVNLTLDLQEIDWNSKETLLENGSIDLVWNGMTITEERAANMCVSVPYLFNKQVAVIMKADAAKFTSVESMKNAIMTAETGSAGEEIIQGK
ncbi:MAG: transporter substrate-binding domain-containing protein [Clostridia bacterium]|nr:transporter substrate-binding domain-containing protein [Clostridia bacterium]